MEKKVYSLMEWKDRRYQHVRYVSGTGKQAQEVQDKLNRGYTGPRFVLKEVEQ